jgi:cytoskeleton protein RodZ
MGWGEHDLTGFGRFLKQAREYKGVSLRDAERKTRIPRRHLLALECEEFHQLPPLIYARGIVRNYAQYLGLDPMDALSRFEQSHGQRSGGFQVVPAVKTTEVPSHWAPNFAIIAFMVIMSAVIFAWMYSAYFAPPENGSPTEQAMETPEQEQEVAVLEDDYQDALAEGGGETLLPLDENESMLDEPDDGGDNSEPDVVDVENQSESVGGEATASSDPEHHTFLISTRETVWVQATVDGEIVLDDVIQAGATIPLQGQSLSVVSGNAPSVNIAVDGEERGPLGEVWDATATYP